MFRFLLLSALLAAQLPASASEQSIINAQFDLARAHYGYFDDSDSFDQLKPGKDGVRTKSVLVNAQLIAWPPEELAKAGYKTQQEAYVHDLACRADAIMVATARSSTAAFGAGRRSIITRTEFVQPRLLRAKPGTARTASLPVMIHSGALSERGQRYRFENNIYPGYIRGRTYLLWLQSDPRDVTLFYPIKGLGLWDGPLVLGTVEETSAAALPALQVELDELLARVPCRAAAAS